MIHNSGLWDAVNNINISILGDREAIVSSSPKIKIRYHSTNFEEYERPILRILRQDAVEAQANQRPFKALYLHSKGISDKNQDNPCVTDWVDLMLYFNVEKWRISAQTLDDHQTCGINWRDDLPHYSGIFWWARSDYLATLPAEIGSDYLDPEMWLGKNHPKYRCLFDSVINHYCTLFPRSMYEKYTYSRFH